MIELLEKDIYFINIYIYYKCILLHNLLAKRIIKIYKRGAETIENYAVLIAPFRNGCGIVLLYLEHL